MFNNLLIKAQEGLMNLSLLAKKTSGGDWSKLKDKGEEAKSFVENLSGFINTYIWIPVVLVIIFVGLAFAFGGRDGRSTAKSWVFWMFIGIAIVLSAITVANLVVSFLSSDASI